ncbi:uncharacterized protein LOC135217566 [Macrobrachium nipponense]|uniref:uncharacterized protein LOC135217566 n=1 Tax=Macrobrachium nipponense TaxID=159736 RepID=UPI0030C897BA
MMDIGRKHLLDTRTCRSSPLATVLGMPTVSATSPSKYIALLHKLPDDTKPKLCQMLGTHGRHAIITMVPPTHAKFRHLLPKKLQDAKQAFAEMERMSICRKASSPWASPLHMVKMPDCSWRPCGDYSRLNLVTMPDHYPLPNMQDLTGALHGAKISTKMDLLMAWCTNDNWKVLLGLQTAPKANSEESPAEKVYGEALAGPGEFFPTEPDD